jgi:thiaminase
VGIHNTPTARYQRSLEQCVGHGLNLGVSQKLDLARDVREQMDTLFSTRGGEHRLASLQKLFTDATRLEQSFWDMGLHQSW